MKNTYTVCSYSHETYQFACISANQSRLSTLVETIDPSVSNTVWCADQMGSHQKNVVSSGFGMLDRELPGGWSTSAVIELLVQKHGIGEMRLLRPALTMVGATRRVVLIHPPYMPQIALWSAWGLPEENLLLLKTPRTSDALWTAEQVLRNGSCGAVLFWQNQVRVEAIRRLHLAAQSSEMLCWMIRPQSAAQNPSPSPLRLTLTAAEAGLSVHIIKRRGPRHEAPLCLRVDEFPESGEERLTNAEETTHTPPAAKIGKLRAVS